MQKQEHVTSGPDLVHNGANTLQHAVERVQAGATKAAAGTEKVVRRYPLAAVGLALGAGIALGAAAHRLLHAKRPKSMFDRARGFTRLF